MAAQPVDGSDVSREPFWTQFKSFGYVYWVANWIALVERFADYGVRVVLPAFMVAAFEQGGPELTQIQKGRMPLAEARPLEADRAYEIFFVGAMFLAFGTAIFKPGVPGLIASI